MLMKSAYLKRFGAGFAFLISFSLLYVQLSADPCPLHDRPTAHANSITLSCGGQTCICFLHTYCPPMLSSLPERPVTAEVSRDFPTELVLRRFFLSVYHPPRA
jgi:hypothetical protein